MKIKNEVLQDFYLLTNYLKKENKTKNLQKIYAPQYILKIFWQLKNLKTKN